MQGLLYFILLMFAPQAFAGYFDPPPTDQSVHVLGMIFGSNIGTVYLGGAANPVMSNLMEKFNFIIVAVGTIVVSYVAILSVVNTAQEGETMGKRWSAVWTPLRTVAGMALMIPSPASGYSIIQVTVAWIILQGIGAADQIWTLALDGLKQGASASAGIQTAPAGYGLTATADSIVDDLLSVAICMEAMQQFGKSTTHTSIPQDWLADKAMYIKAYTSDPVINTSATESTIKSVIKFGVEDPDATGAYQTSTCGSMAITSSVTAKEFGESFNRYSDQEKIKLLEESAQKIYETKKTAISNILSVFGPLAESIVENSMSGLAVAPDSSDTNHPDLKRPTNSTQVLQPSGYYQAAIGAYTNGLSTLIIPVDAQDLSTTMKNYIEEGKRRGWQRAGSYYFVFNQSTSPKFFADIQVAPTPNNIILCDNACVSNLYASPIVYNLVKSTPVALGQLGLSPAELQSLNTYLATGNIYLTQDKRYSTTNLSLSSALAGASNPIIDSITAPMYDGLTQLMTMMNGDPNNPNRDVLYQHSQFGRNLMLSMEKTWISIIAITAILSIPAFIPFIAGPAAFLFGMLMTAFSIVLPVIALVWSIGASLAIYAPLIPFIIFTTATVGWLIAVIEAIIAAPLIALGLIMPSGDELGKLQTSLMILANIFFRPMLMVIGFLIAGRVYNAIVHLVQICMLQVFNTIDVKTLFSAVIILFIYASFIISLTNTSFSLIYGLPDKILRWLGGAGMQADNDMTAAKAAKSAVSSASKEMGSSGGEIGSKMADGVHSTAKTSAEKWASGAEKRAEDKSEKKEAKVADNTKKAHEDMRQKANFENPAVDPAKANKLMMEKEATAKKAPPSDN